MIENLLHNISYPGRALAILALALGLSASTAISGQPNTGSEPKWSPDGDTILYVDGKFPEGREIMIMNADGSGVRRLTSNNYADEYPTLSPDRTTILFSSNRAGGWKLFVMDADGSNQRDLGLETTSSDPNDQCRAEWSPDGKLIVFPVTKDRVRTLHIANQDGSGVRAIPNGTGLYPHWAPDGKRLVFYDKGNLHTIEIDGTNRKRLTKSSNPASEVCPNYPQWSPDGCFIFFLRGDDIFRINSDGADEKQVSKIPGAKWYLGVSSKGKMVYTCIENKLDRIYVLETDGSGLTLVTK